MSIVTEKNIYIGHMMSLLLVSGFQHKTEQVY
uniref:Uncharacterized protein n=1 Tax=Arundo donax TaxID=35708 RepID=A0A0A9AMD6_ARUDO